MFNCCTVSTLELLYTLHVGGVVLDGLDQLGGLQYSRAHLTKVLNM